jgi:hypothetical protein
MLAEELPEQLRRQQLGKGQPRRLSEAGCSQLLWW